jgi:hypothetical protein
MPRYTLKSCDGRTVSVEADDDHQARRLAMTKLHGPTPQRLGTVVVTEWHGDGLSKVTTWPACSWQSGYGRTPSW